MLEIIKDCLPALIAAVLLPIATIIGRLIARLIKELVGKIENDKLQSLAYVAVRYVEQKFEDLHGKDKLDKAYESIAAKLPGVEKEDIEKAIEAAVKELNLELGN